MIITASEVVSARLGQVWRASAPAMINLATDPPIDDERLTALKSIKDVTDVEGYLSTSLEWRLSPDQPWTPGALIARADYKDQTYAKLELVNGHWPTRKLVAVEKGAESNFNIPQGQQVYLRLNDHEYAVRWPAWFTMPFFNRPALGVRPSFIPAGIHLPI